MGLCVAFWVWALVFPLAYYTAYVYFLSYYEGKKETLNFLVKKTPDFF